MQNVLTEIMHGKIRVVRSPEDFPKTNDFLQKIQDCFIHCIELHANAEEHTHSNSTHKRRRSVEEPSSPANPRRPPVPPFSAAARPGSAAGGTSVLCASCCARAAFSCALRGPFGA